MGENSKVPRDGWSKLRDGATAVAAVAIPVVIAILGNEINLSLKDSDVKLKTVEIAISILQDDPRKNPESPKLRNWAISVIDQYSGVSLPEDARKELQSVPISRPGLSVVRCSKFPASLEYRRPQIITVTEDEERCLFSINGATQVVVRCPTIPAALATPFSASVIESEGRCTIDLGDRFTARSWMTMSPLLETPPTPFPLSTILLPCVATPSVLPHGCSPTSQRTSLNSGPLVQSRGGNHDGARSHARQMRARSGLSDYLRHP